MPLEVRPGCVACVSPLQIIRVRGKGVALPYKLWLIPRLNLRQGGVVKEKQFDPRLMRVLAWSGPFLVACWVLALVGGGFIPPKSPDSSAVEITNWYVDNETQLRIASVVLMVTGSFWATWGAAVALL